MGKKNQHNKQPKQKQTPNLNRKQIELHSQIEYLLKLTTQAPNPNVTKELEAIREIDQVLQKIKKLEKRIDDEFIIDDKKRCDAVVVERFTTWLKENGALFEGTSIAEFPGYDLGLKAEIDIPEASLIIAVPRKLMFTIESIKNSSCLGVLEKFSQDNSFWKPYLDILPATYTTVLYFNIDELEKLTGSPSLKTALNQIKNIARQYAYFHKLVNAAKDDPACEVLRKRFTYREYW
ncbi:hypothetical protein QE152_g30434 [Popillia japonica]|uniref:Uncharacterized protein n=1 Tax=Popillia japonica TaxID=7064 RepID=A0AAW1JEH5_POPJA